MSGDALPRTPSRQYGVVFGSRGFGCRIPGTVHANSPPLLTGTDDGGLAVPPPRLFDRLSTSEGVSNRVKISIVSNIDPWKKAADYRLRPALRQEAHFTSAADSDRCRSLAAE
jgi:hypothetical protein